MRNMVTEMKREVKFFQRHASHSSEFTSCSHVDDSQMCTSVSTLVLRHQGHILILTVHFYLDVLLPTHTQHLQSRPHLY